MGKIALITGISGQTGSYLAEYLLELDYEVHGVMRRTSQPLENNFSHFKDKIHLHHGDMMDGSSLYNVRYRDW